MKSFLQAQASKKFGKTTQHPTFLIVQRNSYCINTGSVAILKKETYISIVERSFGSKCNVQAQCITTSSECQLEKCACGADRYHTTDTDACVTSMCLLYISLELQSLPYPHIQHTDKFS
ncbi:hypothetical protein DPMN_165634 [Dreissena polymorpha]|uniref:EB domain-containing protein n=1 Tax=Dreissena polymorpha TaxID=45954 RepID=A0A9D4EVP5_DREPO|nr:hypothetical protein DPMN_165634 [Dreissena polymorpha]